MSLTIYLSVFALSEDVSLSVSLPLVFLLPLENKSWACLTPTGLPERTWFSHLCSPQRQHSTLTFQRKWKEPSDWWTGVCINQLNGRHKLIMPGRTAIQFGEQLWSGGAVHITAYACSVCGIGQQSLCQSFSDLFWRKWQNFNWWKLVVDIYKMVN